MIIESYISYYVQFNKAMLGTLRVAGHQYLVCVMQKNYMMSKDILQGN